MAGVREAVLKFPDPEGLREMIAIPEAANVPATYGAVVVRGSANAAAATAFVGWLEGADGQAVLAAFGFRPAS